MVNIKAPRNITIDSTINFLRDLQDKIESIEDGTIVIDFDGLNWTEPFSCLLFALGVKSLNMSRDDLKFKIKNVHETSYAAYMGFFRAMGSSTIGPEPGSLAGSSTHVPFEPINLEEVRTQANQQGLYYGQVVEEKSDRLATVLLGGNGEHEYKETFSYIFRETLRNSAEHSQANCAWVCAQYWPRYGKQGPTVEIGLVDEGIGLMKSLCQVPSLSAHISNDFDAVELATAPGITRTMLQKYAVPNEWHNSGYGLYVTRKLGEMAGSTTVFSNGSGVTYDATQGSKLDIVPLNGTAVKIRLKLDRVPNWGQALRKIQGQSRVDREKWAHIEGVIHKPSEKSFS